MITEPISMFLRSALYKRTAQADLRKTQRLTPAVQNEIAVKALPPERAARANRAEAERKATAEAQKIVAIWNSRQAGGRALWFYPTIGAAIAASFRGCRSPVGVRGSSAPSICAR
jgi:hypothetical protein